MANMGYCRFQNTLRDLQDCEENMDGEDLGGDEKVARLKLLWLCHDISMNYFSDGEPNFKIDDYEAKP